MYLRACVLCVLALLLTPLASGSVRSFKDVAMVGSNAVLSTRAALFSAASAPAMEPPGNGASYFQIKARVAFPQSRHRMEEGRGGIHVLILNETELSSGAIGYLDPLDGFRRHFCCTAELLERSRLWAGQQLASCSRDDQIGALVVKEDAAVPNASSSSSLPFSFSLNHWYFSPSTTLLTVKRDSSHESAFYSAFIIDCNSKQVLEGLKGPKEAEAVVVSADFGWMNPYGHLSGHLYPLYPFYGVVAFAHLVLACFWLVSSLRHLENLMPLQAWITGLIAVGMLEATIWYFDYHSENSSGLPRFSVTAFALSCSALKRSLYRILLVLISSGYGLNHPFLNADSRRIILLGCGYCLFSTAHAIAIHHAGRFHDETSARIAQFCMFPSILFDALIFGWMFQAINTTLAELQKPRHVYKLRVFQYFIRCLKFSAVISTLVLMYEMWIALTDAPDDVWELWWLEEATWFVLCFCTTTTVVVLFSPISDFFRKIQEPAHGSMPAFFPSDTIDLSHVTLDKRL